MQRVKTFDATGIAPNGKLFAGDMNAIQDAAASASDLTQNLRAASLAIGETGLVLSRYGAGEARISGAFRTDGGITSQGIIVAGATVAAGGTAFQAVVPGATDRYGFLVRRVGDTTGRWGVRDDGALLWGLGAGTQDVNLYRSSAGNLMTDTNFTAGGNIFGASVVATQHHYNRVANAVYYFGVADDYYIQRNAASTRLDFSHTLYTPNEVRAGSEVTARSGAAYQTWIGYSALTGFATLSFVDGFTSISREVDGIGNPRLHYNAGGGGAPYHVFEEYMAVNWIGSPSYAVHVAGDIYASGTVTWSDDRWKNDMQDIGPSLKRLLNLTGRSYKDASPYTRNKQAAKTPARQIGFLGSQVEQHFPELVSHHDEVEWETRVPRATKKNPSPEGKQVKVREHKDIIAVNYQGFIPYIVEALREINDRLTAAGI